MKPLAARVRKHQHDHPIVWDATQLSRRVIIEAADALGVRARWYETRGYEVPKPIMEALQRCCAAVGVDPMKVGTQ